MSADDYPTWETKVTLGRDELAEIVGQCADDFGYVRRVEALNEFADRISDATYGTSFHGPRPSMPDQWTIHVDEHEGLYWCCPRCRRDGYAEDALTYLTEWVDQERAS